MAALHFANRQRMARPGGNPHLGQVRNQDTNRANQKRRLLADSYSIETGELLYRAMQEQPGMSLTEYATWLNAHGWLTRRGKRWTATQVRRVFKRLSLVKRPSVV